MRVFHKRQQRQGDVVVAALTRAPLRAPAFG